MEGYESENYRLDFEKERFVLKLYANTPELFRFVTSEDALLHHLAPSLKDQIPYPIQAVHPKVNDNGTFSRLLTFIPGQFFAEVDKDEVLLQSLGHFLGKLNQASQDFSQGDFIARRHRWDLQHYYLNRSYLPYIKNAAQRKLVDYFFLQFETKVLEQYQGFRRAAIHGDANDWNLLVRNGQVSGLIDFGDACYSPLINELAIALAYAVMGASDPLQVAQTVVSAYHKVMPLEANELAALYYLVALRLCVSVCNSAFSKLQQPDSDYITISERPAWDLLERWISINPIKAKTAFRSAAEMPATSDSLPAELLRKRQEYLGGSLSLSYQEPIPMAGAAFQYMYDLDGNTFLDAYNNIPLVGHCHPTVVKAGQKAIANLNTNTRYLYPELTEYAEQLLAKLPAPLSKVFFLNCGSAASDLAVRMARTYTGAEHMIIMEHGYHGNTTTGIQMSHYKFNGKGGQGASKDVTVAPLPDAYRAGQSPKATTRTYADLLKERLALQSEPLAGFIAEPIVGCGGQIPLSAGYLQEVYAMVREKGGLCISDEVQVGFGRLGEYFWGFEMHGVIPDIVVLGKPMGNTHPMGAVVTTAAIAEAFNNGMEFFSSFGGNPVSCSIGQAVLEVLEAEQLQEQARLTGLYFQARLRELQPDFPCLGDIRGSGLFLGIEMIEPKDQKPATALAATIKNEMRRRFILVSTDGPYDNVLKVKPPLCFNTQNVDTFITNLTEILQAFFN